MTAKKTKWPAALALACASLVAGCGDGKTLVVTHVEGDRSGVVRFIADAVLNDTVSMDTEVYSSSIRDFGLLLPAGTSGALSVVVGGFDSSDTCPIKWGSAATTVSGQSQVDLTVEMGPPTVPCTN